MNRRSALEAAVEVTRSSLTVLSTRRDSSSSMVVCVEIAGLPAAAITWVAHGPTREDERIDAELQHELIQRPRLVLSVGGFLPCLRLLCFL